MPDFQLNTPVAFIIFNRPDTTAAVFAEIARAKPPKLLVIADGARSDRSGEAEKCAATRRIIEGVNWDCEVIVNYSNKNLGCKNRVASGLDWVFEQVPEAIILEDDCLPDPSFFRFCEELLERYREDERISMISGANFQFGRKNSEYDYYFSRYNHIWGWASWRRVWQHYSREARIWPEFRDIGFIESVIKSKDERRFWTKAFQSVYDGKIDTWDYQLVLALWGQGMVSVIPSVNLISNIGFGADATHTTGASMYASIPVKAISFPLRHPEIFLPDTKADSFTAKSMFTSSIIKKAFRRISAMMNKLIKV
jgi:hypothetical protein